MHPWLEPKLRLWCVRCFLAVSSLSLCSQWPPDLLDGTEKSQTLLDNMETSNPGQEASLTQGLLVRLLLSLSSALPCTDPWVPLPFWPPTALIPKPSHPLITWVAITKTNKWSIPWATQNKTRISPLAMVGSNVFTSPRWSECAWWMESHWSRFLVLVRTTGLFALIDVCMSALYSSPQSRESQRVWDWTVFLKARGYFWWPIRAGNRARSGRGNIVLIPFLMAD